MLIQAQSATAKVCEGGREGGREEGSEGVREGVCEEGKEGERERRREEGRGGEGRGGEGRGWLYNLVTRETSFPQVNTRHPNFTKLVAFKLKRGGSTSRHYSISFVPVCSQFKL